MLIYKAFHGCYENTIYPSFYVTYRNKTVLRYFKKKSLSLLVVTGIEQAWKFTIQMNQIILACP